MKRVFRSRLAFVCDFSKCGAIPGGECGRGDVSRAPALRVGARGWAKRPWPRRMLDLRPSWTRPTPAAAARPRSAGRPTSPALEGRISARIRKYPADSSAREATSTSLVGLAARVTRTTTTRPPCAAAPSTFGSQATATWARRTPWTSTTKTWTWKASRLGRTPPKAPSRPMLRLRRYCCSGRRPRITWERWPASATTFAAPPISSWTCLWKASGKCRRCADFRRSSLRMSARLFEKRSKGSSRSCNPLIWTTARERRPAG
mmetsp:Transcript_11448/g.42732  ORF Transcript_11448/g.42732 Transcript_11448/m.42732 type:complete len:261 (+) Transcript_11448:70-852(+)